MPVDPNAREVIDGTEMHFFFLCYGDHRDLHNSAHSFPTRRSSDLNLALQLQFGRWGFGLSTDFQRYSLRRGVRSEEHTSELQSLAVISYAVFCLKKKKKKKKNNSNTNKKKKKTKKKKKNKI